MQDKIILSVDSLSKKYQDLENEILAIEDISFNISKKEFISIIGPSGCGKSTLLSILSGTDKDYKGNLIIKNNTNVGYMLQSDCLFPWRTILDNCLIGLEVNKKLTKENIQYVKSLLKKYELEDFMYKYPDNLSGGMRQRVALIRTLALKPDILLLDEPLSALDSQTRLTIGEDIFNIIKNENITAIMVTHDIGEALSISDRIIVLTKRPAKIKNIYLIPFNNLDYYSRKLDTNYNQLLDQIWRDLDVS